MDTKFQTSFIPKSPVVSSGAAVKVKQPVNLVSVVALLVFVLALFATGGLFAYERYLTGRIATMGQQLDTAKASFETELMNEFTRLDLRLSTAELLVDRHIATSAFFEVLQKDTVKAVQFTEFTYTTNEENGLIQVMMRGVADSYNAIALQSSLFGRNPDIKNPTFTDLDLNDKGNVTFSFKADISPSLVAHRKTVPELSLSFDGNE